MSAPLQIGLKVLLNECASCCRRRTQYTLDGMGQGPQLPKHWDLEKLFYISTGVCYSREQLPIVVVNVNGTACDERRANDRKSEVVILRHGASNVIDIPGAGTRSGAPSVDPSPYSARCSICHVDHPWGSGTSSSDVRTYSSRSLR